MPLGAKGYPELEGFLFRWPGRNKRQLGVMLSPRVLPGVTAPVTANSSNEA